MPFSLFCTLPPSYSISLSLTLSYIHTFVQREGSTFSPQDATCCRRFSLFSQVSEVLCSQLRVYVCAVDAIGRVTSAEQWHVMPQLQWETAKQWLFHVICALFVGLPCCQTRGKQRWASAPSLHPSFALSLWHTSTFRLTVGCLWNVVNAPGSEQHAASKGDNKGEKKKQKKRKRKTGEDVKWRQWS